MNAVSPSQLRGALSDHCVEVLDAFFAAHAPATRLPRTFAGHAVGADVRADVVFTLGHLAACGVETVAGQPIDDLIRALLAEVDGAATHSFFSYRIAETLLDQGPFAGNPLLRGFDAAEIGQVAAACDSSSFVPLLDRGQLPRNYAAVLSRCEQARVALGLVDDRTQLDALLARLGELLGENPRHALDDSHDASGRYDIYTADVWLFCEPLAPALGADWRAGLADALALVEALVAPDGTSFPWGRSTGVLSIALTAELAAAAIAHDLGDSTAAWLRRGSDAARAMRDWFGRDGVVSAHQHRDQDRYRGPARRLQLTFDLLGKLAWAARTLQRAPDTLEAAPYDLAYPPVERLVVFDDRNTARLWAIRNRALAFALPFVGAARSHYLPAPVRPGTFEVPVDQDLVCWAPLVIDGYQRYTGGGLPASVEHSPGRLVATWDGFVPTAGTFATEAPAPLSGRRRAEFRVERRTLVLHDHLTLTRVPQAVSILVPEVAARPLSVDFVGPTSGAAMNGAVSVIDVGGIAEWQTAWSNVSRVHQLDLDPATTIEYSVRVTPKLRIASTAHGHHYHRSLYDPIDERVVTVPSPLGTFGDLSVRLDDVDIFHLHWPEWLAFDDLAEHERVSAKLEDRAIPVVWTAHNLTAHSKEPDKFDPVYAHWARHVHTVIHHSEFGRGRMLARYDFAPHIRHAVVPHGHFGALWRHHLIERDEAERLLGFAPCELRIGIVGAPRVEKLVREFAEGFAASGRDDVQLAVWSLRPGERLPDDARIVAAERYSLVDAATYARRLSACDVLALPFDPDGEMLATGTVADAIGVGKPVLASDWGFLVEYLGDARIGIGDAGAISVRNAIDALTLEAVARAAQSIAALHPQFEWTPIAGTTFDIMESTLL